MSSASIRAHSSNERIPGNNTNPATCHIHKSSGNELATKLHRMQDDFDRAESAKIVLLSILGFITLLALIALGSWVTFISSFMLCLYGASLCFLCSSISRLNSVRPNLEGGSLVQRIALGDLSTAKLSLAIPRPLKQLGLCQRWLPAVHSESLVETIKLLGCNLDWCLNQKPSLFRTQWIVHTLLGAGFLAGLSMLVTQFMLGLNSPDRVSALVTATSLSLWCLFSAALRFRRLIYLERFCDHLISYLTM